MTQVNIATAETVIQMQQQHSKMFQLIVQLNHRQEGTPIDHRLLPRNKKTRYDFEGAKYCINRDYLGPQPKFRCNAFRRMFRVTRTRFEKIAQGLCNTNTFHTSEPDAVGQQPASVEAKILIALKSLAYGCPPHAFRDYFQMSETLANRFFIECEKIRDVCRRKSTTQGPGG
jgi:hypothetical protein